MLPPTPALTLPPAIDLELGGNCGARPSAVSVRKELDVFIEAVRDATGRGPHPLHHPRSACDYLKGALPDIPLWLRDVYVEPHGLDGRPWEVWQYLPRGRVNGIVGPVDQNAFWGDAAAFTAFVEQAARRPEQQP